MNVCISAIKGCVTGRPIYSLLASINLSFKERLALLPEGALGMSVVHWRRRISAPSTAASSKWPLAIAMFVQIRFIFCR